MGPLSISKRNYGPQNVLSAFFTIVNPMTEQIFNNEKESRTLASLPDTCDFFRGTSVWSAAMLKLSSPFVRPIC